jgi:hypothetical protein
MGGRSIAPSFLTWVLDGGGQLHAPAALLPGKEPLVLIGYEAVLALERVRTQWIKEKSLASTGNRNPAIQPVAILTQLFNNMLV